MPINWMARSGVSQLSLLSGLSRCPQCFHHRSISSSSQVSGQQVPLLIRRSKLPVFDYGRPQTSRRRVYMFGSLMTGALGTPDLLRGEVPREYIHRPVRNRFGGTYELKDIAVGHGFTLASVKPQAKDGPILFGTGFNTSSQLGYQEARRNAPLRMLISFAPISLHSSGSGYNSWNILSIGAGRAHTLISIQDEGLMTLGDNTNGQCGRFPIPDEVYFPSKLMHKIPIQLFNGENIVQIVSKFDVTFCLTETGKVYSFGMNDQCQLGRGRKVVKYWEPFPVEGDIAQENIVKLATSGSSVLAVNRNGDLFAWGCNTSGEINPDQYGKILTEPIRVPLEPKLGKIIDCAVGEMCSFILSENGNVYTWGRSRYLGLGPTKRVAKNPTIIPPPLFGSNEFSPDVRVKSVYSSFTYSCAVNSEGSLYTWGRNENGCLGLGMKPHKSYEQFFPLRVSLSGYVEKVGLGVDHTVVLCKGGI